MIVFFTSTSWNLSWMKNPIKNFRIFYLIPPILFFPHDMLICWSIFTYYPSVKWKIKFLVTKWLNKIGLSSVLGIYIHYTCVYIFNKIHTGQRIASICYFHFCVITLYYPFVTLSKRTHHKAPTIFVLAPASTFLIQQIYNIQQSSSSNNHWNKII